MHQLLVASTTYKRLKREIDALTDLEVVTMGDGGKLYLHDVGDECQSETLNITMLCLNWDLFMLGAADTITRLVTDTTNLEFVQTAAAGLDNPLFKPLVQKSKVFCNSDAQSPPIAEFVIASVLNRWHRFDLRNERQRNKQWEGNQFREMIGSNWLIIGFGNIGQRIATQAKGFGAQVTGLRRKLEPHKMADKIDSLDQIRKYLPSADVVVLACALNDETRGMCDEAFFGQMKPDAVFVNIARGGMVVESDLRSALDHGLLDYAVLDVFETEPLPVDHAFWTHERVQMTPHASNAGVGTAQRGDELFLSNLNNFLAGKPLRNLVDPASI